MKRNLPVVAAALVLIGQSAMAGKIAEDFVRRSSPISPTARVKVHNTDGRIMIYGSKGTQLDVFAMRRAFSPERLEAIKIDVVLHGETAVIETSIPPPASPSLLADRSGTVDYVIYLPESCTLEEVKLDQGEIVVEGMRGPMVVAELARGLMHVRDCFTTVRASLGQGRMRVRYGWWEGGDFSLTAAVTSGDLHVAVPAGAAMDFDAVAERGRITNQFAPAAKAVQRWREHFGGESAVAFTLRTGAGDIRLERSY